MNKYYGWLVVATVLVGYTPCLHANQWGNYRTVEKNTRSPPPTTHGRPHYPTKPNHAQIQHQQPRVHIQYQAPIQSYQQYQQHTTIIQNYPNTHIQSSQQNIILDWKRHGLPAPPSGHYWLYEHGRYVLVPQR